MIRIRTPTDYRCIVCVSFAPINEHKTQRKKKKKWKKWKSYATHTHTLYLSDWTIINDVLRISHMVFPFSWDSLSKSAWHCEIFHILTRKQDTNPIIIGKHLKITKFVSVSLTKSQRIRWRLLSKFQVDMEMIKELICNLTLINLCGRRKNVCLVSVED